MNERLLNENFLKDISIKRKLILIYIFCMFIPLLFMGVFINFSMRKIVLQQTVNEAKMNVDRVEQRIKECINIAVDISNKLYADTTAQQIASQIYTSPLEITNTLNSYTDFEAFQHTFKEIDKICIYTDNDTIMENTYFMKATENVKKENWYKKALSGNGVINWEYIAAPYADSKSLALTRSIGKFGTNQILVIYIHNSYLQSILGQEQFNTIIANKNGDVIASNEKDYSGKNIKQFDKFSFDDNTKISNINYNGTEYKMLINHCSTSGEDKFLQIIALFPVKVILKPVYKVLIICLKISFVTLIAAGIFIIIFSVILSKRAKQLSNDMHKVALGNLDYGTKISGKDEFGMLGDDLNLMVKNLKSLIDEVYITNLQKRELTIKQREIEFKMLASQINPHFLFNSLETIRMKALCNGEREIADAVKLLGWLMRRSLELNDEMITIESELDFIKTYLKLQKFRFGNKINYVINVDKKSLKCTIPPVIIQPIVENAVVHGIEQKENDGNIIINIDSVSKSSEIFLDGNEVNSDFELLKISIRDDGVGIDEDKINFIKGTLEYENSDSNKRRIGLRNVHQRIKLCYGDSYGLEIYSGVDKGTTVEMLLPKIYK